MPNPVAVWLTRLNSEEVAIHSVQLQPDLTGLDAVSASLPGGAYTTIRTYQGDRLIRVLDQVQRLEQSARLAGKPAQLDEARLRLALRSAMAQTRRQFGIGSAAAGQADLRLRLTLDLEFDPAICISPSSRWRRRRRQLIATVFRLSPVPSSACCRRPS